MHFIWPTGIRLARFRTNIRNWLPGVAGTEPRLGIRFGASIGKRGLAPAPSFIFGQPRRADSSPPFFFCRIPPKKVSGRWGHRPLGRGDGGKCNQGLARYSTRVAELAISSATYRSNQSTKLLRNPAQLPTTFAILQSAQVLVDSPADSFLPVLQPHLAKCVPVPSYSCPSWSPWGHVSGERYLNGAPRSSVGGYSLLSRERPPSTDHTPALVRSHAVR
jgi:hypothetical protein